MSDNIKWLDVVLDYGKRFPTVTMRDIGLNSSVSCHFSELRLDRIFNYGHFYILSDQRGNSVLSTFNYGGDGVLTYWNFNFGWSRVHEHILLRLLTEGKEDLI